MARLLRVEYAGAMYHVTVRGNARREIFLDDRDRQVFLSQLSEQVERHAVKLHLFCLMTDHFHLLVETPHANLGRFMHGMLTGYTVYFNRRHGQGGHVTQGRYGARLVAGDAYLLKLSRYIHLNPVKIKKWADQSPENRLTHLRGYAWSSYRGYAGLGPRHAWVTYDPTLGLVAGKKREAAARYREYVETGIAETDEAFRGELMRSALSLGDEKFREWVADCHADLVKDATRPEDAAFRRPVGRRLSVTTVLDRVAKVLGVDVRTFRTRRRNWHGKGLAAYALVKHAGLTQRECAECLGVRSGSGVSRQIRSVLEQSVEDADISRQLKKTETILKRERV
jgi:REP element-mobilizing transposase RayT